MPAASLIVTTYNQPAFLRLALASANLQSRLDFEVIVADDGSTGDTRVVIEELRRTRRWHGPLKHAWHAHEGFRRAAALNNAVRHAETDYLIFTDGDCLLHRHFVGGHLEHAANGTFLVGRCARLGPEITSRITLERVERGRAQRVTAGMVLDGLRGRTLRLEQGIYVANDALFRVVQRLKKRLDVRGGNFSCFRSDFVRVNGYNERFVGWGREDEELGVRLRNLGLRPVSVGHRAVIFHLWHGRQDRDPVVYARNTALKREAMDSREHYCPTGFEQR